MSIAASPEFIDALVSGLPSHERGNRQLMILQSAIDDTGTHPRKPQRFFMLAGLTASVDAWKSFDEEWRTALSEPPALEYFKMSQALSLKDQFSEGNGWTAELRDERLVTLAKIARRHALFGMSAVLDRGLYDEFVKSFSPFRDLRDPYFLVFYQIIDALTEARGLYYPEAKGLDYIFDDQGALGERAIQFYKTIRDKLPYRRPEMVGSLPVHRNDKTFSPLQAADLYAGAKRIQFESGSDMPSTVRNVLNGFEGLHAWQRAYTTEDIMLLGADLVVRQSLRKIGR